MSDLTALRAALAKEASRRARQGQLPGSLLGRLRLVTTAELLCPAPPPVCAADAAGELRALCLAAEQMLRRRSGWLQAEVCRGPLPVLARATLLQAAVLAWLRGALVCGAPGVLLCCRQAGGDFSAALRLPAADGLPLRPVPDPRELMTDRYGLPRMYLDGFCAEPER